VPRLGRLHRGRQLPDLPVPLEQLTVRPTDHADPPASNDGRPRSPSPCRYR
jgi:hypothetical protein